MRVLCAKLLRNHWHVLLIVPLAVILMTWPTFPRIFDPHEVWLHAVEEDKWYKIWDAWHIEHVLAGRSDLYYTDSLFHPSGLSLAFHSLVLPHALLMAALKTILPADDAYNLLFLLILCFNAFCAYPLIKHLTKDKWISLFGSIVFVASVPFGQGYTNPDLITIGTLPLTVYLFLRSVTERRRLFAGLAGICAGITAFIGVYVFAFTLLTVAILALMKSWSLWWQRAFWRDLLIFVVVCGLTSMFRFYPMLLDRADLELAMNVYQDRTNTNDVLHHFVLPNNPFTGALFCRMVEACVDHEMAIQRQEEKNAYLGYTNLILIGCALLFQPRRGKLLWPWIVILVIFAIFRLGSYLTFNGIHYTHIVLPDGLFRDWFPTLFEQIGVPQYYQLGVVTPLAVLSSYGLAALIRSKPVKARMLIALLCALIVLIEFYTPRLGQTIERHKTAYTAWLRSEPDHPIKLINLAAGRYRFYLQTLTGYPHAYGGSSRLGRSARRYIEGNLLLRTWGERRSVHCLPHNERAFLTALDQLVADGFTHIVVHNWRYGDQFIIHSFRGIPAAYDNGSVSVFRLADMRLSCDNMQTINSSAPPENLSLLARTSWVAPGKHSSILSFQPTESIDTDLFAYFASLFSDWHSLLHLYLDDGNLIMQSAGINHSNLKSFARDNHVVYLLYNSRDADSTARHVLPSFDEFNRCRSETHEDDAVIELYLSSTYSCALFSSDSSLQVEYDNGAALENLLYEVDQDVLDVQIQWRDAPEETHSISIQIVDAVGDRVRSQDSVVGDRLVTRHTVDVSSLTPGDYVAKLIFYRYSTGKSVSGTISSSGARFDRELKFATIRKS